MTQAPHLLPGSRSGFKYGPTELVDHMAFDGLHDAFTDQAMGALTEDSNDTDGFTREQQDEVAVRSHRPRRGGRGERSFRRRDRRVPIPQRKGDPIEFVVDEGVRADTTAESLGSCGPRSARTGRSPLAMRRGSPTAHVPSSS